MGTALLHAAPKALAIFAPLVAIAVGYSFGSAFLSAKLAHRHRTDPDNLRARRGRVPDERSELLGDHHVAGHRRPRLPPDDAHRGHPLRLRDGLRPVPIR